jgi:acetyl esterase/lipase
MSRSRHLVAPEFGALADSLGPGRPTTIEGMRASSKAMSERRPPLPEDGIAIEQRFVPGPDGAPDVRVLIYRPPGARGPLPVYLDIHGGAYVSNTADIDAPFCRAIVAAVGCAVVSVDYRVAPETHWPGAVEDCLAALRWVAAEGGSLGFDASRIAIGGESAGGGLTAALALMARDRGGPKLALQMLGQPMLDDRTGQHPYAGEYTFTAEANHAGWTAYLGVEAGSDAVPGEAVPARVADLSGLPPAFITVGALDLLADECVDYAKRLMRAGVPTELHVMPGAFHGAIVMAPNGPVARASAALMFAAIRRALGTD